MTNLTCLLLGHKLIDNQDLVSGECEYCCLRCGGTWPTTVKELATPLVKR